MAKILVVDDEKSIRKTLREILEFEKHEVDESPDGMDAVVRLKKHSYELILLDIKMPKMDGMEALERIRMLAPDTQVIMISGHGNVETAVEAVKKGAYDFISKPPDLNRLLITVRNALDKSDLQQETRSLKQRIRKKEIREMIGDSKPMQDVKNIIDRVAPTDARVLITGPNGTGKELAARRIHEKSNRASGPFVEVNCAAIPPELIESELFGHEKGAFTSAHKQHIGKFEQANGGTLFLDEIGDMSHAAQAKVLRALQENTISRVGGDKQIPVNVRVLAATNKDLHHEITEHQFREDLYHRLAVIIIRVPSLNERKEDIPSLVEHFNQIICRDYGIVPRTFKPGALDSLEKLDWTGNIRELQNVVERLIILCDKEINMEDIEIHVAGNARPLESQLRQLAARFEKEVLIKRIEEAYKLT